MGRRGDQTAGCEADERSVQMKEDERLGLRPVSVDRYSDLFA